MLIENSLQSCSRILWVSPKSWVMMKPQHLSILENQQSLINPIVEEHKGTIIKKMGDGFLIEFPSTVEAVECAIIIIKSEED